MKIFSIDFRFDIILWNFSNLSSCVVHWFCLFFSTGVIVYWSFHSWSYWRLSMMSKNHQEKQFFKLSKRVDFSKNSNVFSFVSLSHLRSMLFDLLLFVHRLVSVSSCSQNNRRKLSDRYSNNYSY